MKWGECAPDADVELGLGMIWGVYTHTWRYTFADGATCEQLIDRTERKLRLVMKGLAAR